MVSCGRMETTWVRQANERVKYEACFNTSEREQRLWWLSRAQLDAAIQIPPGVTIKSYSLELWVFMILRCVRNPRVRCIVICVLIDLDMKSALKVFHNTCG